MDDDIVITMMKHSSKLGAFNENVLEEWTSNFHETHARVSVIISNIIFWKYFHFAIVVEREKLRIRYNWTKKIPWASVFVAQFWDCLVFALRFPLQPVHGNGRYQTYIYAQSRLTQPMMQVVPLRSGGASVTVA